MSAKSKKRFSWRDGAWVALKGTVVVSIMMSLLWGASLYYRVGIDPQEVTSISGYWVYLRSLGEEKPSRGDIFAFEIEGMEPIFEDGRLLAKYVRGVPGDCIKVSSKGVFVNDMLVAEGFSAAHRLDLDPESFYGQRCLKEKEYWMLGDTSESFDSRYFGAVGEERLRGYVLPVL